MKIIQFTIFFFFLLKLNLLAEPFSLKGEAYIEEIPQFVDILEKCNTTSQKIIIPTSLNTIPHWKDKVFLRYCKEIELPNSFQTVDLGLSLGYIDHFYRVYWNGNEIGSTKDRETQDALLYDEPVILKISKDLVQRKNLLEIQVQKNQGAISGGGIYGGILEIDYYISMKRRSRAYAYYNFSKVVLFLSASILFLILYVGRKKEQEYLYFSIFLLILTIYYFTKLELKYELELNILLLKKIEYLCFSLILPSFSHFLHKMLKISRKNFSIYFINFFGIFFFFSFLYFSNIQDIENFNYLYHIPFILVSLFINLFIIISQIKKKNKRALPIFVIVSIPILFSLLQILNIRFGFLPFISGLLLGGDAIVLLVIFMASYVGGQFYFLQKRLDNTIQREESLRKTFQLYVPPADIEKILSSFNEDMEPTNIGTLEEKSILFCDIRDFTLLSEKMSPSEVVELLNSYFSTFNNIILENGGVIDKLIGDCIMARFDSGKEMYAVRCALQIQEKLKVFNKMRKHQKQKPIANGVGISLGEVILGNIGSQNKMDFTVIGDSVNVASRLESLTKFYRVPILVTETFFKRTQEYVTYREIDKVIVKGKKKPIKIYQPLSIDSEEWLED
jgi:class 3 adenylate cyclase